MDVAVITGAGTGIGRATSIRLAESGVRVLGVGRRPGPLAQTRARNPEHITVVSADIAEPDGRRAVLESLPEGGRVRFLINNAAVLAPVTRLTEMPLDGWRHHMSVNVEGPLFLTQTLFPRMEPGARVLNISSGAAHGAYVGWGAYCTSKAALYMVTRALDEELREHGIRVGSVRPGVVDTPMQNEVRASPEDVFPTLSRFLSLKETGGLQPPDRVARFLTWFLTRTPDLAFAGEEVDIRDMREEGDGWVPASRVQG